MNWIKQEMAQVTNPAGTQGTLADVMVSINEESSRSRASPAA